MTEHEDFIIEVLDLLKSKFKRGDCTKEQTDAIYNLFLDNYDVMVTADDLSRHYNKSRDAIHSVIKRRMFEKPKRNITLYSFKAFSKLIPSSWRKKG